MSLKERWAQAGLVAFRLPSGLTVSGIAPTESDLIRRGLMPGSLRAALAKLKPGTMLRDLDDTEHAAVLEGRLRTGLAFVRGMYDDESGEWERVTLAFDELEAGAFPSTDIAALEQFVALIEAGHEPQLAAEMMTEMGEAALGLRVPEPDAPAAEAEETVDGFAAFRDEPRGVALREDGGPLEGETVDADRDPKPVSRPRRRRRAVPATGDGAGSQPAQHA